MNKDEQYAREFEPSVFDAGYRQGQRELRAELEGPRRPIVGSVAWKTALPMAPEGLASRLNEVWIEATKHELPERQFLVDHNVSAMAANGMPPADVIARYVHSVRIAEAQRDQLQARVEELDDENLRLRDQAGEMAEELERLRRTSIVDHSYAGQEIKVEFDDE